MARRNLLEDSHAEWLDELLAGTPPDVTRLRAVMGEVGESVHLDYKAANAEDDTGHQGTRAKLEAVIKKYVPGFANGAGGVLVYGVSERTTDDKAGQKRQSGTTWTQSATSHRRRSTPPSTARWDGSTHTSLGARGGGTS